MRIMILDHVPVIGQISHKPVTFDRRYTTRLGSPSCKPISTNQFLQSVQTDPIPESELFGKLETLLKDALALLRKIPESSMRFTPIGGDEIDIKIKLEMPIFPETQDQISTMVENLIRTEPPTHTFDIYECVRGR